MPAVAAATAGTSGILRMDQAFLCRGPSTLSRSRADRRNYDLRTGTNGVNVLTSNSFATPSYGVPASVLHWGCASDEAANRGSRIRSATRSVGHKWCRVANGQMGSAQNARRGAASDAADKNDPEKRPLSVLRPLLTHAPRATLRTALSRLPVHGAQIVLSLWVGIIDRLRKSSLVLCR